MSELKSEPTPEKDVSVPANSESTKSEKKPWIPPTMEEMELAAAGGSFTSPGSSDLSACS